MMKLKTLWLLLLTFYAFSGYSQVRQKENFNKNWSFSLTDSVLYCNPGYDDSGWRILELPHDWSIEGEFSKEHSGRNAWLPGGTAWYRKTFEIPASDKGKHIEIQFDGIYRHSNRHNQH